MDQPTAAAEVTPARRDPSARESILACVALAALLIGVYAIYAPGLTGWFLFDDYPNLSALDTIKSSPTPDQLIQFFLHGISSPTGRPLSLATFAIQAFDWPKNPAAFLRVNLLLHLANGLLLCWLFLRATRLLQLPPRPALWIPIAATALWLAAPIQVSAVIYIIQRMTELSATFVFAGVLLYLIGRDAQLRGEERRGLLLMSAGVATGLGLGVLAKENAVLLPLLILVTEFTLLGHLPRSRTWKRWALVMLGLPVAALVAFLALRMGTYLETYAIRDFTLGQRLMTEARVLFYYLYKALVPAPSAIRLLYDDYPVSQSLWQPWTTALSLAGVVALVAAAWKLRARAPVAAFAVLWFFTAHLLESTFIPLELVFEHRNYQATIAVFFALAWYGRYLWRKSAARHVHAAMAVLAVTYFALLCTVTWQVATLWGKPLQMSAWWAHKLPDSRRAKIEFLGTLLAYGLTDKVVEVANDASRRWDTDPMFNLVLMHFSCHHAEIAPPPIADTVARIRATRREIFTVSYLLDTILGLMERDLCKRLDPRDVQQLVEAAFENPLLLTQRRNLLLLYSRVLKVRGLKVEGLEYFRQAVDLQPMVILLLQGSLDELAIGRIDRAYEYLERAESDPRIAPMDRWTYRHDIEAMRKLLEMHEQR